MEIMNVKLAGVVILYHPDTDVWHNIQSYISSVEKLYIIDNTEQPDVSVVNPIKNQPKIQYIAFHKNRGIAYALNYALMTAKSDGYTFLLTMDQDSSFTQSNISAYIKKIKESENSPNAIVSYAVNYGPLDESKLANQIITYYITSGSVLNVDEAIALGMFDENLFIDQVDSEFAYRARTKNKRIVTFFDIYMHHRLGNTKWYNIGSYKFAILNHGPIRKYYIFRNLIYVMRKYPFLKYAYRKYIVKEFIKVLFFEKDKWKKIKYIFFAFQDAHNGKYGKCTINN